MCSEHGIERAPVDPFAIAKRLGIVVQASDDKENQSRLFDRGAHRFLRI